MKGAKAHPSLKRKRSGRFVKAFRKLSEKDFCQRNSIHYLIIIAKVKVTITNNSDGNYHDYYS
jgi:hypothetical protein